MSLMTVFGYAFLFGGIFAWGAWVGGAYEYWREGGTRDLKRDLFRSFREYDELLSLLSTPPVSKVERGTLHAIPVGREQRSPLTVVHGGDAS